jgi:hypothetical protein
METVGAAAGVTSLVGFAGQILQGLVFLCGFFGDVHDAPDEVAALVKELKALELLIRRIASLIEGTNSSPNSTPLPGEPSALSPASSFPSNSLDEIRPALELCGHWTDKLRKLVLLYESTESMTRRRKTWNNINLAFRRKKLDKYTEALQRGKLLLLQSHLVIMNLSILDHTIYSNKSTTQISEQLSKLALNQSSHTTILTQAQESLCSVDQNVREVKSSLDSLLTQFDIQCLARLLGPAIANVVSYHISLEIQRNREKLRLDEVQDGPSNTTISQSRTSEAGDAQYYVDAGKRKLTSASPHSNIKRRCLGSFKSYNLWFGKILVSTETYTNDSKSQLLRTEVILLPAIWLLRKGATIMIDRVTSACVKPVINYSIRPLTIIPNHSPIFSAIADGNIHLVQELFTKGMASPFDHTSEGKNILGILFGEIFGIAMEDSQRDKLYGDITHVPPRRDAPQLIKQLKSFAKSLIELGVDAGCRDNEGW